MVGVLLDWSFFHEVTGCLYIARTALIAFFFLRSLGNGYVWHAREMSEVEERAFIFCYWGVCLSMDGNRGHGNFVEAEKQRRVDVGSGGGAVY